MADALVTWAEARLLANNLINSQDSQTYYVTHAKRSRRKGNFSSLLGDGRGCAWQLVSPSYVSFNPTSYLNSLKGYFVEDQYVGEMPPDSLAAPASASGVEDQSIV